MAKKSSLAILYLVGMALVVLGFCLPMFTGFGGLSTPNGFNFINFNKGGFVTIGALLIFIGAAAGVVRCFIAFGPEKTVKMICLLVSIIGGIVLVIGFTQNKFYSMIAKGFLKHATYGFYILLAGWVCGIVGFLTNK